MNMMLVTVTERTSEIGLRKALGAEPRAIQTQFIIEALFLSLLGGLLGVFFGAAISLLAAAAIGFTAVVEWSSVLLGFCLRRPSASSSAGPRPERPAGSTPLKRSEATEQRGHNTRAGPHGMFPQGRPFALREGAFQHNLNFIFHDPAETP